jgi:sRNA-binding regulator protein Hfq
MKGGISCCNGVQIKGEVRGYDQVLIRNSIQIEEEQEDTAV